MTADAAFYDNPDCRHVIAQFHAEREIFVFPAHYIEQGRCTCRKGAACESAGKHPAFEHWQSQSSIDPKQIRAWWTADLASNVGLDLTKSGLLVVDIDVRPDGDGWDTWSAFLQLLTEPLPRTWTVRTGSGGVQYPFWLPPSCWTDDGLVYPDVVKNLEALGLGKHVDIQGKGKLVIAPGSWNLKGQYRYLGSEDGVDPLDPETPDNERRGPGVFTEEALALLTRKTMVGVPAGPRGPVEHTVMGKVVARVGLVRGTPTAAGYQPILCPWAREAKLFDGGHGIGCTTRTVVMGAIPGSRVGWLHCFSSKCTGSPEKLLAAVRTDRARFPDGRRWLVEIDAELDAAGIEPLSTSFQPHIPDDPSAPEAIVEDGSAPAIAAAPEATDEVAPEPALEAGPPPSDADDVPLEAGPLEDGPPPDDEDGPEATVSAPPVESPAREPGSDDGDEPGDADPNARARPAPWCYALPAPDFLAEIEQIPDWFVEGILMPGALTRLNSPRGLGKTNAGCAYAVQLALAGKRVLLFDRDNPKPEIRRRLRTWGATLSNIEILSREHAPALTEAAAWKKFPLADYDVIVIDSWDSSTEGVGEQDSAKPSKAQAILLDLAHRENGPAILLLANTTKRGEAGRGAGTLEDREDIVMEVRDATGLRPTGRADWWTELPDPSRAAWAERASRRVHQERLRLAFVYTKFRVGREPDPFIVEIDFTSEPWTLTNVTADVVAAGVAAREAAANEVAKQQAAALEALTAEIARREAADAQPLTKQMATAFIRALGLGRNAAATLIDRERDRSWRFEVLAARGSPIVLRGICSPAGEIIPDPETLAGEGLQKRFVFPAASNAAGEIPGSEKPSARRAPEAGHSSHSPEANHPSRAGQNGPAATDPHPAAYPADPADPVALGETNARAPLTADDRRRLDQEAEAGDPLARVVLGLPPTRSPGEQG